MKKLLSLLLLLSFNIKAQDVKIGTQTWTTKNLNVTKYRNGDAIPQVQDRNAWANLTTGAWCYYENKGENGTTYGKLYNWFAVNDKRGLAPKGYHIPKDAEWTKLSDYLGGESVAGAKMKSNQGWYQNGNGTNTSGFAGHPGGYCDGIEMFWYIVDKGFWWSSSESSTNDACCSFLNSHNSNLSRQNYSKGFGFSVRCVKD